MSQFKRMLANLRKGNRIENPQQNVDPRAKEFLDKISSLLENEGIKDKKQRDDCSFALFEITKECLTTHKYLVAPNETETLTAMALILEKYGIKDPIQQENIILTYFKTLCHLGGVK